MIYLKTPDQINHIEHVNKLGAEFLQECREHVRPGVIKYELQELAKKINELILLMKKPRDS